MSGVGLVHRQLCLSLDGTTWAWHDGPCPARYANAPGNWSTAPGWGMPPGCWRPEWCADHTAGQRFVLSDPYASYEVRRRVEGQPWTAPAGTIARLPSGDLGVMCDDREWRDSSSRVRGDPSFVQLVDWSACARGFDVQQSPSVFCSMLIQRGEALGACWPVSGQDKWVKWLLVYASGGRRAEYDVVTCPTELSSGDLVALPVMNGWAVVDERSATVLSMWSKRQANDGSPRMDHITVSWHHGMAWPRRRPIGSIPMPDQIVPKESPEWIATRRAIEEADKAFDEAKSTSQKFLTSALVEQGPSAAAQFARAPKCGWPRLKFATVHGKRR